MKRVLPRFFLYSILSKMSGECLETWPLDRAGSVLRKSLSMAVRVSLSGSRPGEWWRPSPADKFQNRFSSALERWNDSVRQIFVWEERGRGRGSQRLEGEQFKHPDGNGKSDPAEPSLRSTGVVGRSAGGKKTHCLLEREADRCRVLGVGHKRVGQVLLEFIAQLPVAQRTPRL